MDPMNDYDTLDLTRHIAGQVRALMAKYGVSQSQMAASVGTSQSQLSKMVRGVRPISIDQLDAMCFSLGVESWELVREAEEFLAAHDRRSPARLVFAEHGVALRTPHTINEESKPAIVQALGGRRRNAAETVESNLIVGRFGQDEDQSIAEELAASQRRAASKRSRDRGEDGEYD